MKRIQFFIWINVFVGNHCNPVAGVQAAGPNFAPGSIGQGFAALSFIENDFEQNSELNDSSLSR